MIFGTDVSEQRSTCRTSDQSTSVPGTVGSPYCNSNCALVNTGCTCHETDRPCQLALPRSLYSAILTLIACSLAAGKQGERRVTTHALADAICSTATVTTLVLT